MHGHTVFHRHGDLALDKRKKIVYSIVGDIIVTFADPLFREKLLLISCIVGINTAYFNSIRLIGYSLEDHHYAAVAHNGCLYGFHSDSLCLVYIRFGADMRRASLHYIKLYRAYFTADLVPHKLLKCLAYT